MRDISGKMFTQTARALERDGLLKREIFPVVPPKVEYSLTPLGKSAIPVIMQIGFWGEMNVYFGCFSTSACSYFAILIFTRTNWSRAASFYIGGVHHGVTSSFCPFNKDFKNLFKNSRFASTFDPGINCCPFSKGFRGLAPGRTGKNYPDDSTDNLAFVNSFSGFLGWQMSAYSVKQLFWDNRCSNILIGRVKLLCEGTPFFLLIL